LATVRERAASSGSIQARAACADGVAGRGPCLSGPASCLDLRQTDVGKRVWLGWRSQVSEGEKQLDGCGRQTRPKVGASARTTASAGRMSAGQPGPSTVQLQLFAADRWLGSVRNPFPSQRLGSILVLYKRWSLLLICRCWQRALRSLWRPCE
jgi:hypothetical protein